VGDVAVVIAETPQFSGREVTIILLVLLVIATFYTVTIGLVGALVGLGAARLTQDLPTRRALPRGSSPGFVIGAVGLTIVSWILLFVVASSLWTSGSGRQFLLLGSFPLPIGWGWFNGRRYRYGGPPGPVDHVARPSAPREPPEPFDLPGWSEPHGRADPPPPPPRTDPPPPSPPSSDP